MSDLKYVVTGSSGFIGRNLVKFLKDKNLTVYEVPSEKSKWPKKFDIVFALGGLNGTDLFYTKPATINTINYTAPLMAVHETLKANARLIFTGSPEEYASSVKLGIAPIPTPEDVPLCVDDIKNPRWSYATAKIAAESMILGSIKEFGLDALIVRPNGIYGPGDSLYHVIPTLIRQLSTHKLVLKGWQNTRSFMHVDDFNSALLHLADKGEPAEIYNVASNEEVSIQSLAKTLFEIIGEPENIVLEDAPEGSAMRGCPDISKLLGTKFSKIRSLKDGLTHLLGYPWIDYTKEINDRPCRIPDWRFVQMKKYLTYLIQKLNINVSDNVLFTDLWTLNMEPKRDISEWLRKKCNLTMLDLNLNFVDNARKKGYDAVYSDISNMPDSWTDKFDFIIDHSTCDHCDNLDFVFEYYRVLKPEGRMLLINGWDRFVYRKYREVSWFSKDLEPLLKDFFKVEHEGDYDSLGLMTISYEAHKRFSKVAESSRKHVQCKPKFLCAYHWYLCKTLKES